MEQPRKKRNQHHYDRVSLRTEALRMVDGWIRQVNPALKGQKLNRADVVNWLILKQDAELSGGDMQQIAREHFDPIRSLEWAVAEVKNARARGESIDIKHFLSENVFESGKRKGRGAAKTKKEKRDGAGAASVTADGCD